MILTSNLINDFFNDTLKIIKSFNNFYNNVTHDDDGATIKLKIRPTKKSIDISVDLNINH